ncbi:MAG: hypothetical protein GTO12_18005 [Proteobacteria bacterium]|nr:hypothetical protein [Pseudomonadota bacterium]
MFRWGTKKWRPIETVLSGPAASVVGAWHLVREANGSVASNSVWVMDMGGTTTDIAFLEKGRPRLNHEGARIGRWRTMVEAVDVHTVGLGGDSQVLVDSQRRLKIGPRRLIPLCQLAREYSEIRDELKRQLEGWPHGEEAAQFLMAQGREKTPLSRREVELLRRLEKGPVSPDTLRDEARSKSTFLPSIERLEAQRLIARSGFTPTDALHVLDQLKLWDAEASWLGAEILALKIGLDPKEFCRSVIRRVSSLAAKELVTKALTDEGVFPCWSGEPVADLLVQKALTSGVHGRLTCRLTLTHQLAAIGAPVAVYLPRAAKWLNTRLIIPAHVEVANAVGAVVGAVILRQRVTIMPIPDGDRVRVYLHQGVWDFEDLEKADDFARKEIAPWLVDEAQKAGAVHVEIKVTRQDRNFSVDRSEDGESIYLGSELNFTAVGRPKATER